MFDRSTTPRVFGLAPGVDFPQALVDGLRARMAGQPPEAMARVELIVNTRRMQRRLREIFDKGPAGFLPRIRLLTTLDGLVPGLSAGPSVTPLRRRLELVQLVSGLLEADPTLAPRSSLYALADSLAGLIDEMQGEGVDADDITALDVTDQSGHWERAQRFLRITQDYLADTAHAPDAEARQRALILEISRRWQTAPPEHPVILAGSTGSRGTTMLLMQAIAMLPLGAVVLPGYDFDMPSAVWQELEDQALAQDHPQYRFHALMQALSLTKSDVAHWADTPAPSPARNALVSLSLRPAPVTHAWLKEGPGLGDLTDATQALTLLEAPTPRIEALCIAMRLRKAVADGQTAALITPDRMLTRQVTSALDRWGILPDDSAGLPLQLTPPGRFLRHVAGLMRRRLDAEALLVLLKHPLTHSGTNRNLHQLHTQRLEMAIRNVGLPYPDPAGIARVAAHAAKRMETPEPFLAWASWVAETFPGQLVEGTRPLPDLTKTHLSLANAIAAGPEPTEDHELWKLKPGQKAEEVMATLSENAGYGGSMSASDYADLVGALLSGEEVRDRDAPHTGVMIWGTLEARVQGADLIILGGLNDGTWPEAPPPDPWLNRRMRKEAGMLLPERRIGLSAHDYQQAIAAPEVWITRAIRSDEAETVPSRWINRLGNLMNGLPQNGGAEAWKSMQARGDWWLGQAQALEAVTRTAPAPRPSPCPPVAARPRQLSVTAISQLIRDPYAIYVKNTLRLRPIDDLVQSPDAQLRGIVLHTIMERFVKSVTDDPGRLTSQHLIEVAQQVLEAEIPWPTARMMWLARIARVADWFVERETARRAYSSPAAAEKSAHGVHEFKDIGFTLHGYADRIDLTEGGDALIYDYKTGNPPTAKQQKLFDKQLLIEAAMVEQGSFAEVGVAHVAQAVFIGLGASPKEVAAPLDKETPADVLQGLYALIRACLEPDHGFTARRFILSDAFGGDYDQLARYGEWDGTQDPLREVLT